MALSPPKVSHQIPRYKFNFSPTRSQQSIEYDSRGIKTRTGKPLPLPQYEHWTTFQEYIDQNWNADPEYGAEHMIIVGQAGSGKTTLARELLRSRDYVVVFGTKTRDRSLYDPLKAQGYVIQDNFDPQSTEHPKVIFRPPLEEPTTQALLAQRSAFRGAILGIFQTGGWTIFCDELRYLTETLKLQREMDLLWLQGRSMWITIVGLTQRPVSVPLNAFEQATHFIVFRVSSFNDRKRASEYTGMSAPIVFETIRDLPHHEFLYVNKVQDMLMRSRVEKKNGRVRRVGDTSAHNRPGQV